MIQKGNKIIAQPGYYLTSSRGRQHFCLPFLEGVEYTETEIPGDIEMISPGVFKFGPFQLRYTDTMKKDLVQMIYSMDDQIAIILNKDGSENGQRDYDLMQGWRDWFSGLIHAMESIMYNHGERGVE